VNTELNRGSGSHIWLNLGPNAPERVWKVQFMFKLGLNTEPVSKLMNILAQVSMAAYKMDITSYQVLLL
jgi:hypothetical protein